jgi:hypothetical protein
VRSLVTAAGALGVVTVADEVDSPADLELCRGLGLHAAKGDLVGPFSPLETYSDLLHAGLVPLPESFDPRTHDALTGDPLSALPAALAAAPPTTEPDLGPTDERGDDLAESDLLSRDVLAAIRWLDELDRTAQERVQAATEHDTAAPTTATAPNASAPTAPSPAIPEPSAALDAVPALAPLEPPPPAPRMPGLDLVEPAAEVAPPPALWAAAAPTTEPVVEPVAEPAPPAEPVEPVQHPSEDLVIELRDAPIDIGAALAAELGVDLTPFDAKVGALAEAPGAAVPSAPAPPVPSPSPFAGMTLPPSPFLRTDPGTGR